VLSAVSEFNLALSDLGHVGVDDDDDGTLKGVKKEHTALVHVHHVALHFSSNLEHFSTTLGIHTFGGCDSSKSFSYT
jgi:hypothetical protein